MITFMQRAAVTRGRPGRVAACATLLAALLLAPRSALAEVEDIEFIAEHLPEVAMDNRYATLPVWGRAGRGDGWAPGLVLGYSRTGSGNLRLAGPTLAVSAGRELGGDWAVTGYGFVGRMSFSGSAERRPLSTVAIPAVPLPLPAEATFDSRGGRMEHAGLGLAFTRERDTPRLGVHRWMLGAQVESVRLRGYAFDYRIVAGPARGTTGVVDFSAGYDHVTPIAGVAFPRVRGQWSWAPHALLAVPLPRRGIVTRMTGPGFDLSGDSARAGTGKHFGDPALALGIDLTYRPWGLTVDLGSTLTQATLERYVHRGIERNLSIAVAWQR